MTYPTRHKSYDAVIIGARCAGAATGMLLARAGARVLIVERDPSLGDTLSTHAIMRPGVTLLDRWGLLDRLLVTTPAVTQTQFQYAGDIVTVPIKPWAAAPGLIAPRRWILDTGIIDAARDAGAEVQFATSFCDVVRDAKDTITGVVLQDRDGTKQIVNTPMVIGADGRRSLVADRVGAQTHATSPNRAAVTYAYLDGLPNTGYRWFYDQGRYGGIIPTSLGQSCVFAGCRPQEFKRRFADGPHDGLSKMFAGWDDTVAEKLIWRDVTEKPRQFLGATGHRTQRNGPGWALVGDAACFKDPASAHGITDAFLDAGRLAEALIADPIHATGYAADRDAQTKPLFEITQKIASFDCDLDQLKVLHRDLSGCMKSEQLSLQPAAQTVAA